MLSDLDQAVKNNGLKESELMIFLLVQHGRLKVRTSAEQAAAKQKEREKKMKVYNEVTEKIFSKVVVNIQHDFLNNNIFISEKVLTTKTFFHSLSHDICIHLLFICLCLILYKITEKK